MEDEHSLTALIADLEHPEKPVIRAAADALIRAAAGSAAVSGALNRLLADPQRKNRWAIAYVLAQLPAPPGVAIAALLDALDHQEADIRWAIALLLVHMAKENRQTAEALLRLCREGTPTQRRQAVYCIRDLDLQDSTSRQALMEALRDEDPRVRIAAAVSLRRTAGLDRSDHDALLSTFFADPDARVRSVAALTLAQTGYAAELFFQALEKEGHGGDESIGRAARAALDVLKKRRAAPYGS
jgi:HEAT repeat protein